MSDRAAGGGRGEGAAAMVAAALLVFGVTFAVFVPSLSNEFTNWDDDALLLEHTAYRGPWPEALRWAWTTTLLGHWVPATWMSWSIDYALWGQDARGFHLTNVLLHAVNAVLVFVLGLQLLWLWGDTRGSQEAMSGKTTVVCAAAGALVFAVHPLRVESVSWITERRDVLSAFFLLPTVLCYLRAHTGNVRARRGWMTTAVVCFVLSLLSKATGVSLVAILILLDVFVLRRLGGQQGWWGRNVRGVWVEKIPFVVLTLAAMAMAPLAQGETGAIVDWAKHGLAARLVVAMYGLVFYAVKTVWPAGLSPLYELKLPLELGRAAFVSAGLAVAAAVMALVLLWLRRRRAGEVLAGAALAYVFLLLPVLGFVQSGPQMVADRYSYLPAVVIAVLVAAGLRFLSDDVRRMWVALGAVVIVCIALAGLTVGQQGVWRDSKSLWLRVVEVDPDSSLGHQHLAGVYETEGDFARALQHLRDTLRVRPQHANARIRMAGVLTRQGKLDEAEVLYRQALDLRPDDANAAANLANLLVVRGMLGEAIDLYGRVLEAKPQETEVRFALANALAASRRLAEGVAEYRRVLEEWGDNAAVLANLGAVLVRLGRDAEGEAVLWRALEVDSTLVKAHSNLSVALWSQGKYGEAIAVLRAGLEAAPHDIDMADALARQLVTCPQRDLRSGAEALMIAQRVCAATGYREPGYMGTLAAAQAETGQIEAAGRTAGKALELAREQGKSALAATLRAQLGEYEGKMSGE